MELSYENPALVSQENMPMQALEALQAEKKFEYFFKKLAHNNDRKNNQRRKSSMDETQCKISSILGINEDNKDICVVTEGTPKSKDIKYQILKTEESRKSGGGKSPNNSNLHNIKIQANLQVAEFQEKVEKISKKIGSNTTGTSATLSSSAKKGTTGSLPKSKVTTQNKLESVTSKKTKTETLQKASSNVTNNRGSSTSVSNAGEDLNMNGNAMFNPANIPNRRASITTDQLKTGFCKYDFLVTEFSKVFGPNLENYDERVLFTTVDSTTSREMMRSLLFLVFSQKNRIENLLDQKGRGRDLPTTNTTINTTNKNKTTIKISNFNNINTFNNSNKIADEVEASENPIDYSSPKFKKKSSLKVPKYGSFGSPSSQHRKSHSLDEAGLKAITESLQEVEDLVKKNKGIDVNNYTTTSNLSKNNTKALGKQVQGGKVSSTSNKGKPIANNSNNLLNNISSKIVHKDTKVLKPLNMTTPVKGSNPNSSTLTSGVVKATTGSTGLAKAPPKKTFK